MENISAVSAATEEIAIQSLATEAIRILAETIQDLTDAVKRTLDQRDELLAMETDYYSNKKAIDALSNFVHASYRRPSDRRRR